MRFNEDAVFATLLPMWVLIVGVLLVLLYAGLRRVDQGLSMFKSQAEKDWEQYFKVADGFVAEAKAAGFFLDVDARCVRVHCYDPNDGKGVAKSVHDLFGRTKERIEVEGPDVSRDPYATARTFALAQLAAADVAAAHGGPTVPEALRRIPDSHYLGWK